MKYIYTFNYRNLIQINQLLYRENQLSLNPNNWLIRIKFVKFSLSTQICFAMIDFSRYLRPMNPFERGRGGL